MQSAIWVVNEHRQNKYAHRVSFLIQLQRLLALTNILPYTTMYPQQATQLSVHRIIASPAMELPRSHTLRNNACLLLNAQALHGPHRGSCPLTAG